MHLKRHRHHGPSCSKVARQDSLLDPGERHEQGRGRWCDKTVFGLGSESPVRAGAALKSWKTMVTSRPCPTPSAATEAPPCFAAAPCRHSTEWTRRSARAPCPGRCLQASPRRQAALGQSNSEHSAAKPKTDIFAARRRACAHPSSSSTGCPPVEKRSSEALVREGAAEGRSACAWCTISDSSVYSGCGPGQQQGRWHEYGKRMDDCTCPAKSSGSGCQPWLA